MGLSAKLESPQGLTASLGCSDLENAQRITLIIQTFLVGQRIQRSERVIEDWVEMHDLPTDFANYRYRVLQ